MKSARCLLLVVVISLFVGCAKTTHLYPGAERSNSEVARLKVVHNLQDDEQNQERVAIGSVDGQEVSSAEADYVAVLPGAHQLKVSYFRLFDPTPEMPGKKSSSPYRGVVPALTHERAVEKHKHLVEKEESTKGATVEVNLEAGKVYHLLVESKSFDEAPADGSWDQLNMISGPAARSEDKGAKKYWRTVLQEEK